MPNDWMWERSKLDPAYSGLDRGYNSRTGALAPAPLTAPRTNATSRIIPAPSNTNWNSTFINNQPTSPSGTDWQKTFGRTDPFISSPSQVSNSPSSQSAIRTPQSAFSLNLSPANDRSNLSLSSPSSDLRLPTSDFQDRTANLDLTSRDHELYGAGPDLGFNY